MADEAPKPPTKLETTIAEVKNRLVRIASRREEVAQLQQFVVETTPELQAQLAELHRRKKRLEDDIALVEGQIKEAEPESYAQMARANADMQRLEEQVKALLHALPVADLTKPREIAAAGLAATVGKASTHSEYNAKAMLTRHPEWASLNVDGDALFERAVNRGVLERLVAQGLLEEADLAPFTTVVKDRAPSVTLKDVDASKP